MSFKELAKKNKRSVSLLTLAAVLPFLVSSVIVTFIIQYQEQIADFSVTSWILFYLAASFCMAFAFTHTTFVALVSGFFLGWKAIPYVIFSYLLALIIGYFLAKKLDKGKLLDSLTSIPKAKIIAEELKSTELKIIVLSRLSPVLPFAMMNLFLSMLDAKFKNYMLGGFAGMLPRTLLFIYTGLIARDLTEAIKNGSTNNLSNILVAALLIISFFGLFYYVFKATRKAK
jgi:uncharacterized membrane protein YdjX (TVP38/TMEM64 family)